MSLFLIGCQENKKPKKTLTPVEDCLVGELDDEWVCVWADEFNGQVVDETKWNFEINDSGGGNNELQYYIKDNATVKDGILSITARNETYGNRNYTSSRITTKFKGDFTYGRFQIKAKNPLGRGTWPAAWMMPSKSYYGNWPKSGEIDIMEYVGYSPNYTHHTIHTEALNHKIGTQVGKAFPIDSTTAFVLYELIWNPGELIWLVDGWEVFKYRYNPERYNDKPYQEVFPFDKPFFLILNLAIGGDWGGAQGVDNSAFPMSFDVDYVRVYQRDYRYLDKTAPDKVENIKKAQLANTLYWDRTEDDVMVSHYNIYIDGEYHDEASVNQFTFRNLESGNYKITVSAVDFTGKIGPRSDIFDYIQP